jgi:hypothetical protein
MSHSDRERGQGAAIIPFPRPDSRQAGQMPCRPLRLLDRVRAGLRARHYSARTERAYVGWIRRFILFHGKRHPETMREAEISSCA